MLWTDKFEGIERALRDERERERERERDIYIYIYRFIDICV